MLIWICAFVMSLSVLSNTAMAQNDDPEEATDATEAVEEQPQQDDVSKALDSTATQWSF